MHKTGAVFLDSGTSGEKSGETERVSCFVLKECTTEALQEDEIHFEM